MRHARTLAEVTPIARRPAPPAPPKRVKLAYQPDEGQPLTPREAEVEGLLVRGLLTKQIARRLGLSYQTVKNHASSIHRKRGVYSRFDLLARHYRGEIELQPPPPPRPVRLTNQPCVVLVDGALVTGTCTGTFTPAPSTPGEATPLRQSG